MVSNCEFGDEAQEMLKILLAREIYQSQNIEVIGAKPRQNVLTSPMHIGALRLPKPTA